jgi:periplasmic protein TonB
MALQLVVDSSGQTRDVIIVSPIGYGLDELAVEAVRTWRTWKFEPARKDGQPVSVAIVVEVAFHM